MRFALLLLLAACPGSTAKKTSQLGDYCLSKDDCAAPMFCTTLGDFRGACTIACPDIKAPRGGCPSGSSCWAASPDGPTCLPQRVVGDSSIPVGPQ